MKPHDGRRVLVVDDNEEMAKMLCDDLDERGLRAVPASSARQALRMIEEGGFDALVSDLRMPEVDGLQLLEASRRADPERPVIVMTAYSAIDTAIESIRRGAYHYLTKPFKGEELAIFLERAFAEQGLRREAAHLRTALKERFSLGSMIGRSEAMRVLFDVVARVAETASPVLITGETGTGKSAIARALHNESARSAASFVTVNCAALPDQLLESELFGHVKGAFTGAAVSRPGLFVEASGGSLFLDEIGELPLPLQAKLLGVLERGVVRPVGAEKEIAVDVRLIAATNRDLQDAVRTGGFREDLLYRLDVISIEVPPLRKRPEDLALLTEHFLSVATKRHAKSPVKALSPEVLEALFQHRWPGNVRELEHVIERLVILGREPEARLVDMPPLQGRPKPGDMFSGDVLPIRELQRSYARWALEQLGGHRGRTAERLGIDGKTLAKWLSDDDGD